MTRKHGKGACCYCYTQFCFDWLPRTLILWSSQDEMIKTCFLVTGLIFTPNNPSCLFHELVLPLLHCFPCHSTRLLSFLCYWSPANWPTSHVSASSSLAFFFSRSGRAQLLRLPSCLLLVPDNPRFSTQKKLEPIRHVRRVQRYHPRRLSFQAPLSSWPTRRACCLRKPQHRNTEGSYRCRAWMGRPP